jgi:large subunit ribosomal protein L21
VSYAVIATGGKQQRVAVGDRIRVEKLDVKVGEPVTFGEVLAVQTDKEIKIGRPTLEGARVVARVVAQDKGPKILIFKKKRRKQYRRTRGHRQPFTALVVEEIHAG